MAQLIEMPFGLNTWVGLKNHVLDGGIDCPRERAILREEGAVHCHLSACVKAGSGHFEHRY